MLCYLLNFKHNIITPAQRSPYPLMNMYESAWKDIVQPVQIKSKKHMLGPIERILNGVKIVRKDLEVNNRNNKIISAFLFHCPELGPNHKAEQTVIYLHGNGGSKL